MTPEELGEVYADIRPSTIRILIGRDDVKPDVAEDLFQTMTLQFWEKHSHELAAWTRPQVEAWFRQYDAGIGKGLKWRVRDANKSEQRRRIREGKWQTNFEKSREGAIYLMNGEVRADPRAVDFTDLVIAKVDAEKAPPPKPKRTYRRKLVGQAA